jgi:eukaryotic-like serine/threonine-protein kinase
LRSKLGESLSSVHEYATPLPEATTSSLEALKVYSVAWKTRYSKGDAASLPFFKQAVELDPNFAEAYSSLAAVYFDLGEIALSADCARKAYALRDKVTERERFRIEGFYYFKVTGELDKAEQTYELWQQAYPRNSPPYGYLGLLSDMVGNYEKSLVEFRTALELEPNGLLNYGNLCRAYKNLNRLDEAEAVLKQAEQHNLQSDDVLGSKYLLAFLKNDEMQMQRLASAAIGKLGVEHEILSMQAATQAWLGKLKNERELTRRAMESAERNGAKDAAASYQAAAALNEVEMGNRSEARAEANAAVKLAPSRDVDAMAALALAEAGDSAGAEKLATELEKTFPLDTLIQKYWLPTTRAAVALAGKDPNRAVELLSETSPIELGEASMFTPLAPVYVRGEAYLDLHQGGRAAADFQKFIDHSGAVDLFPWGALARLGLARAYALQAQSAQGGAVGSSQVPSTASTAAEAARAKARTAYQDFLTLWKDADPDIPILKQAEAEYARLQ